MWLSVSYVTKRELWLSVKWLKIEPPDIKQKKAVRCFSYKVLESRSYILLSYISAQHIIMFILSIIMWKGRIIVYHTIWTLWILWKIKNYINKCLKKWNYKVKCTSNIISWFLSRIQGCQKIVLCVIET